MFASRSTPRFDNVNAASVMVLLVPPQCTCHGVGTRRRTSPGGGGGGGAHGFAHIRVPTADKWLPMQVEEGSFTDSEILVMLGENGTGEQERGHLYTP